MSDPRETVPDWALNLMRTSVQAPQTITYFNQAMSELGLTPQEQFLYQHHLNNLYGTGKVIQSNSDISTVLQAVVTGHDGKYYNIPTVWDGQVLPPDQAAQRAASAGWDKWPSYSTPDAADARYEAMHAYMDKDTSVPQFSKSMSRPQ
jgi:hypothetical protein